MTRISKRYTEEQIIAILKEAAAGPAVGVLQAEWAPPARGGHIERFAE